VKREIVAASYAPGSSVSLAARRYDVNANQVFKWRKLYGDDPSPPAGPSVPRLIPVTITAACLLGLDLSYSASHTEASFNLNPPCRTQLTGGLKNDDRVRGNPHGCSTGGSSAMCDTQRAMEGTAIALVALGAASSVAHASHAACVNVSRRGSPLDPRGGLLTPALVGAFFFRQDHVAFDICRRTIAERLSLLTKMGAVKCQNISWPFAPWF
jgi:transposase-like protein